MRSTLPLVALLVLTLPRAAHAQNAEVERLLRQGIVLRQRGDAGAALASFEQAHQIARTPRTLAQVALAEQALGRWVAAEAHLREALRSADDPWITRNRAALDGALGVVAQHVGQVVVRCDVDGAAVRVAGQYAGDCPLAAPAHVEAGEVEVSAFREGASAQERVRVTAGETAFVTLQLRRSVAVPAAPAEPPVVALPATPLAAPAPPDPPPTPLPPTVLPPSAAEPGSAQRTWGWVTLVFGVIGLGVGGVGTGVRIDGVADYNDPSFRCPSPDSRNIGYPCSDFLDQMDRGETLQWAGFISGGALTLTGILLLATAPSRPATARARFGCGRGPGDLGVACAGTF